MRLRKNSQSGQAIIVGLMVLLVSSIISFGVVLIRESMNKQRRILRVQIAKNALLQEIEYTLKNPLSYNDYANAVLDSSIANIINNTSRKIAGMPCGETGNDCKLKAQYVGTSSPTTVKYKLMFSGTSPRIKEKEYEVTLPPPTSLSNKLCTDVAAPLLEGIDPHGNPVCRALVNTTCSTGQYLIGINSNLTAVCADIEDRNIAVAPAQFIKSYRWNKVGNTLTLSAQGAPRELTTLVSVANSFELGPISFFPRPGTHYTGPTVGNTYFPIYDSKVFKCPNAYPIISFKSVTGNGGLSCGNYALNESSHYYRCGYAKGDFVQREVRLTYECSKRP